jgi:uncharacterized protein
LKWVAQGFMLISCTAIRTVNDHIGLGVFATQPIPVGTVIWVEDNFDVRIPVEHFRAIAPGFQDVVYHNAYIPFGQDYYLLSWDGAKYVNHSCEPNCLSLTPQIEVAVRNIAAGEQLTNHYSFFGLEPWESFACHCNAKSCQGSVSIQPDDRLFRYRAKLVEAARKRAAFVEQPLTFALDNHELEMLGMLSATPELHTDQHPVPQSQWLAGE